MVDRVEMEVDIQVRPVQVMWLGTLKVEDAGYGSIPEPGEILEREEDLAISEEDPQPVS